MTTLAKLLARKQKLQERLQENPGPHERDEIERQLEEIDTALNSLDEAGPGRARVTMRNDADRPRRFWPCWLSSEVKASIDGRLTPSPISRSSLDVRFCASRAAT